MKIEQRMIKIKDIFAGYENRGDEGVFAFGGRLAIRPPYQREFIYKPAQEEAVIRTVLKGYPLNVMYWVRTGYDEYEILDGQQRTLSVMRFLSHCFMITHEGKKYYTDTLPDDLHRALMDYEFMIYVCEGEESEKLEWFRIVNIAGERLTDQELRNSVYTGPWLTAAKNIFSKRNAPAKMLSDPYIKGDPNRQELLEKALKGIAEYQKIDDLTSYMATHQNDPDAEELWQYFQDVINWVSSVFPDHHSEMKGLDWCHLYNTYHANTYDVAVMKEEVSRLYDDDEVQNKKGIFEYLLSRDSDPYAGRQLNLRAFERSIRQTTYDRQKGICPYCHKHFAFEEMEGDHIKPWSKGGKTTPENCQMLCRDCNGRKSDKY